VENSVYVAPGSERRGLGGLLLAALLAECAARGFRQMVAVIAADDATGLGAASQSLHARHGFVHAGRLTRIGFKFGRWLDAVLMERALGAGSDAPPIEERLPAPLRQPPAQHARL
jgi:phosphinothricin acetyltransferase